MPSVKSKLLAALLVFATLNPASANSLLDLFGTLKSKTVAPVPAAAPVAPAAAPVAPAAPAVDNSDANSDASQTAVPAVVGDITKLPAKVVFGAEKLPSQGDPEVYGGYALGCMQGAAQLPMTGPTWQVMRPSRNRNWAMPQLVSFLEKISAEAKVKAGWNGFLVGDIAQPRGGPMLTGHASHQIGLDADVWFTPMPDKVLTAKQRETMAPLEMVRDHKTLNTDNWSESRARLLMTVAQNPQVERIFMHPPIKAEMCRWAQTQPGDHSWLSKMRPLYGHTFHFHIRIKCPAGMSGCKPQGEPKPDDGTGCGKELAYWMSDEPWKPHKPPPGPPKPPPAPLTIKALPAQCRAVAAAP